MIASSAPKGSSISMVEGSAASARASADPLLLAARELGRVAAAVIVRRQTDQLQQLIDPLRGAALVPAEQRGHDRDVLLDPHVREETGLLDDVADLAAQGRGREGLDIGAVDQDPAAGRLVEAVDHLQQRRLAAAGGAEQRHESARLDRQGDIGHGRPGRTGIFLRDLLEVDRAALAV